MGIKIDKELTNIVVFSCGFMFIMSSFQTMGIIEKNLLDAVEKNEANFTGDGYVSLSIVFIVFSIFVLFSPIYCPVISTKLLAFIGSLCTLFFIIIFISPEKTLLYVGSAIQGIGLSLMWMSSGLCLMENSKPLTIYRNSSILWGIIQLSLIIGNLFVYFTFTGKSFDKAARKTILIILTTFCAIGSLIFLTLRSPWLRESKKGNVTDKEEKVNYYFLHSAWLRMKNAAILVITPNMMLLSISFLYSGLIIAFFSGVYTSMIGFTAQIGEFRKCLVSLAGVAVGISEGIGSIFSGSIPPRFKCFSSSVIVGLGFFAEVICFIISFLNFPNNSSFMETEDTGIISPMPSLAIIGGTLLGFGDSCFNIQIYNLLGTIYRDDDFQLAVAFFYFCQTFSVSLSFMLSNYIGLHVTLTIYLIVGILGTGCFTFVNSKIKISPIEKTIKKCTVEVTKNSE